MVIIIPTYRFWFHDYPREHTPRLASFLTFLASFGLVLSFLTSSGLLTFVAYLGTLPYIALSVQLHPNAISSSDRKSYLPQR